MYVPNENKLKWTCLQFELKIDNIPYRKRGKIVYKQTIKSFLIISFVNICERTFPAVKTECLYKYTEHEKSHTKKNVFCEN